MTDTTEPRTPLDRQFAAIKVLTEVSYELADKAIAAKVLGLHDLGTDLQYAADTVLAQAEECNVAFAQEVNEHLERSRAGTKIILEAAMEMGDRDIDDTGKR